MNKTKTTEKMTEQETTLADFKLPESSRGDFNLPKDLQDTLLLNYAIIGLEFFLPDGVDKALILYPHDGLELRFAVRIREDNWYYAPLDSTRLVTDRFGTDSRRILVDNPPDVATDDLSNFCYPSPASPTYIPAEECVPMGVMGVVKTISGYVHCEGMMSASEFVHTGSGICLADRACRLAPYYGDERFVNPDVSYVMSHQRGYYFAHDMRRIEPRNQPSFYAAPDEEGYYHCDIRGWIPEDEALDDMGGYIHEYHSSPPPKMYFPQLVGRLGVELGGATFSNQRGRSSLWKYGLGFEIEKNYALCPNTGNRLNKCGDVLPSEPLFAGWETDSSCGIEGITHVYSIMNFDQFKDDVDNSPLVDLPSNLSCGGHVNMSGPNVTLATVRGYAGLFYALYRGRLDNHNSNKNKRINPSYEEYDHEDRYACIRSKRNGVVEFRLVSRVQTRDQLINRFRLFRELGYAMHYRKTFGDFVNDSEPILLDMYQGSSASVEHIRRLAVDFQQWLDTGVGKGSISAYL